MNMFTQLLVQPIGSLLQQLHLLNKIKIYGKDTCPYTQRALQLLKERNIPFKYKNVENALEVYEKRNIAKRPATVPIIFGPGGEYIGGCEELEKILQ